MEVKYSISLIIIASITFHDVTSTSTTKDVRTGGLLKPQAEKIINGVIDIVQSHKNKPQQNQFYSQYPQQWNSQTNYQNGNFQNGFNSQTQYQGQLNGQSQYNYQNGYNQASNFAQNSNYQGFSAPSQGFSTQGQNQQYQIVYQNTPNQNQGSNYQGQTGQSGQYVVSSQTGNQLGNVGQYPGTGQYQGNYGQYQGTSGQYQGSSGQYQGNSGQYQGSSGHYQGNESGFNNGQGILVPNTQGQGPTCVCQAWTKPQSDVLSDSPVPDKIEKASDTMQQTILM